MYNENISVPCTAAESADKRDSNAPTLFSKKKFFWFYTILSVHWVFKLPIYENHDTFHKKKNYMVKGFF